MGRWDNLCIWKDPDKKEPEPWTRDVLKSHPDPTADIALANVAREERKKNKAAELPGGKKNGSRKKDGSRNRGRRSAKRSSRKSRDGKGDKNAGISDRE